MILVVAKILAHELRFYTQWAHHVVCLYCEDDICSHLITVRCVWLHKFEFSTWSFVLCISS
jgi:hypothetical protein